GGRVGGAFGGGRRRRAGSGSGGHGAGAAGAGRVRIPGEEIDWGVCGGDGRDRGELGAIAGAVLRGAGVSGDRTGCGEERREGGSGGVGGGREGDGAGAEHQRGIDCGAAGVALLEWELKKGTGGSACPTKDDD